MINLLPPEYRKIIEREFFRRYLVVFGLFFILLACAEIIFALVLFSRLDTSLLEYGEELSITRKMSDTKKLETLEIKVDELDNLLSNYRETSGKMELFSVAITEILEASGSSVEINEFTFGKSGDISKAVIMGNAATRDSLLSFIARLKNKRSFEKVESPVSNLLKNADVNFSISMDLVKNP